MALNFGMTATPFGLQIKELKQWLKKSKLYLHLMKNIETNFFLKKAE